LNVSGYLGSERRPSDKAEIAEEKLVEAELSRFCLGLREGVAGG